MTIFIPRADRHWQPEHMRGHVMHRDCYWCGEVRRKKAMTTIKDGPVIWHFCNLSCASTWAKNRLKQHYRKYLRLTPPQIPVEDEA
jgi:hypothetical protein